MEKAFLIFFEIPSILCFDRYHKHKALTRKEKLTTMTRYDITKYFYYYLYNNVIKSTDFLLDFRKYLIIKFYNLLKLKLENIAVYPKVNHEG